MVSFAGILAFVVVLLASPGSVLTQGAARVAPASPPPASCRPLRLLLL